MINGTRVYCNGHVRDRVRDFGFWLEFNLGGHPSSWRLAFSSMVRYVEIPPLPNLSSHIVRVTSLLRLS